MQEPCTRVEEEKSCGPEGCQIEKEVIHGRHHVRFFFHEATIRLSAELSRPGLADAVLARFSGARTESQKIYSYQAYCQ